MAENPVRFGIIGCAEIARKVAGAIDLAPNSILYAIASRSIEKAKNFAATNGLPENVKIYGSYDQVLDDPCVDAVYMPLPTSLHVQWAVLAACKKKHLLLEKPTALDVAELDQILEACESNGVQFMGGSMWLHHPRTAKMKDLLSNYFGQLNFVSFCLSSLVWNLVLNIVAQVQLNLLGSCLVKLNFLLWHKSLFLFKVVC